MDAARSPLFSGGVRAAKESNRAWGRWTNLYAASGSLAGTKQMQPALALRRESSLWPMCPRPKRPAGQKPQPQRL